MSISIFHPSLRRLAGKADALGLDYQIISEGTYLVPSNHHPFPYTVKVSGDSYSCQCWAYNFNRPCVHGALAIRSHYPVTIGYRWECEEAEELLRRRLSIYGLESVAFALGLVKEEVAV